MHVVEILASSVVSAGPQKWAVAMSEKMCREDELTSANTFFRDGVLCSGDGFSQNENKINLVAHRVGGD